MSTTHTYPPEPDKIQPHINSSPAFSPAAPPRDPRSHQSGLAPAPPPTRGTTFPPAAPETSINPCSSTPAPSQVQLTHIHIHIHIIARPAPPGPIPAPRPWCIGVHTALHGCAQVGRYTSVGSDRGGLRWRLGAALCVTTAGRAWGERCGDGCYGVGSDGGGIVMVS